MSVILIMIPAALVLAGLGLAAFIIAAKSGQFDDLDTPALRAVFDDDDDTTPPQNEQRVTENGNAKSATNLGES
jgi:cbb3-type cytochrome oxidase maturation protein